MSVRSFTLYAVQDDNILTDEEFATRVDKNACAVYLFSLPEDMRTGWSPDGNKSVLSLLVRGILAENGLAHANVQTRLIETRAYRQSIYTVREWFHAYTYEPHKLRMNPLQEEELRHVLEDMRSRAIVHKLLLWRYNSSDVTTQFNQAQLIWLAETNALTSNTYPLIDDLRTVFGTAERCIRAIASTSAFSVCRVLVNDKQMTATLSRPV